MPKAQVYAHPKGECATVVIDGTKAIVIGGIPLSLVLSTCEQVIPFGDWVYTPVGSNNISGEVLKEFEF